MENEKITGLLNDILWQLHVITSQNFMFMAHSDDETLRDRAVVGLAAEKIWMAGYTAEQKKGGEAQCPSGSIFSSEF